MPTTLFSLEEELDQAEESTEDFLWSQIRFLENKLRFAEMQNKAMRVRLARVEATLGVE